jgi:hypothetical protein
LAFMREEVYFEKYENLEVYIGNSTSREVYPRNERSEEGWPEAFKRRVCRSEEIQPNLVSLLLRAVPE